MRLQTLLTNHSGWREKLKAQSTFFRQLIQELLNWDAREIVVVLLLDFLNQYPQVEWAWESLGDAFADWEPMYSEAAYAMAFLEGEEKESWRPFVEELFQGDWAKIPLGEICRSHFEETISFSAGPLLPPPTLHLN
jgi:hypothetical protein